MGHTAAVYYQAEDYSTQGQRLMGRQSASEGFLNALARYGTADSLYACTRDRKEFETLCQQIRPFLTAPRQARWIPEGDLLKLSEAGTLYWPDPLISQLAWQRRYIDPRAYSLCGVTHTVVSQGTMSGIGNLLIAPVQPWDALICTSHAVKSVVENLLGRWGDYLATRLNARPEIAIKLPVIPLGVDGDSFISGWANPEARQHMRQQLGVGPDDLVVLFVGRLIFHAKAHPVPMYMAVERAAQQTTARVHLVQAGWFEDEQQEQAFKTSASQFAPSVHHLFVDGRQPEIRKNIWAAADVFISLADNIQETFGLTPIEAMAAGLPVIVSDWNGYKETVRHDIDGFRIPTLMSPAGAGADFAVNFFENRLNYSTFIGHISLLTAIDIEACTQALTALFNQPDLRQRLGANGQQRVRDVYDWRVVIAAYEELWQELAELRTHTVQNSSAERDLYPLCDDPFRLLNHYPTEVLSQAQVLGLGDMATPENLQLLRTTWMTNFGADRRSPQPLIDQLLRAIALEGPLNVAEIVQRFAGSEAANRIYLIRTLVYLLKFDVLRQVKG